MLKIAGPFKIVGLFLVNNDGSLPIHTNMIDIPDSMGDYNVNCCDTDASLSVRLPIPRCVSHSLPPLFGFAIHCSTCSMSR
jgi:hypothetical protein